MSKELNGAKFLQLSIGVKSVQSEPSGLWLVSGKIDARASQVIGRGCNQ